MESGFPSSDFFLGLVEALQKICQHNVSFTHSVEVSGYVCLEVDRSKRERYVISEMMQSSGTLVSESFCSKVFCNIQKPQSTKCVQTDQGLGRFGGPVVTCNNRQTSYMTDQNSSKIHEVVKPELIQSSKTVEEKMQTGFRQDGTSIRSTSVTGNSHSQNSGFYLNEHEQNHSEDAKFCLDEYHHHHPQPPPLLNFQQKKGKVYHVKRVPDVRSQDASHQPLLQTQSNSTPTSMTNLPMVSSNRSSFPRASSCPREISKNVPTPVALYTHNITVDRSQAKKKSNQKLDGNDEESQPVDLDLVKIEANEDNPDGLSCQQEEKSGLSSPKRRRIIPDIDQDYFSSVPITQTECSSPSDVAHESTCGSSVERDLSVSPTYVGMKPAVPKLSPYDTNKDSSLNAFDLGEDVKVIELGSSSDEEGMSLLPELAVEMGMMEQFREPVNRHRTGHGEDSDRFSKHTERKTRGHVKYFHNFLMKIGEMRPFETIPAEELDPLLGNFFVSLRKDTGEEYEPSYVRNIQCSLDRYLRSVGYGYSITRDKAFENSRHLLQCKTDILLNMGKGTRPNRPASLTKQDLEKMYHCQTLGTHSPTALINSIWLNLTAEMGLRSSSLHHGLKWGDLKLQQAEDGTEFLQLVGSAVSKSLVNPHPVVFANKMNLERCLVHQYKVFREHRPPDCMGPNDPFYIGVNKSREPTDQVWFINRPIGYKKLEHS